MTQPNQHFVIGTAGHIDHGKTSLVKHLTGTDTDRLSEEKERGMTIDLGFAFIGDDITIIDVPGHEKFVRNMVAGVSAIDLVLLVIAADDGVMPQTREHLDILKLLQIKQGIIIVTKTDIVESDWVELVIDDIKQIMKNTFLENAPLVRVSNETGDGIDQLKEYIFDAVSKKESKTDKGIFRLPIDRVFTMKGFGTVAAGTVLSGSLSLDQQIELLPKQEKVRVRGLQIHEKSVTNVKIGDRAAINLAGVEKKSLVRGYVLAESKIFHPTLFFDGKFYLLESAPRNLKNTARIRLNIGTNEVIGRVSILDKNEIKPGESAFIQFRLEKPVVIDTGDRFVVRSYSPVFTIGGGIVLDTKPRKHKRFSKDILDKMAILEKGDPEQIVEQRLIKSKFNPLDINQIARDISYLPEKVEKLILSLEEKSRIYLFSEKKKNKYIHYGSFSQLKEKINLFLFEYHKENPAKLGIMKNNLRIAIEKTLNISLFNNIIEQLIQEEKIVFKNNKIALTSHKVQYSETQKKNIDLIAQLFLDEGFATSNKKQLVEKTKIPESEATEVIEILLESGVLIKIDDDMIFHSDKIIEAQKLVKEFFTVNSELTVGDFRQLLNTSRKYSVPLLNYFESIGLTIRQQAVRILNPDFT